MNTETPLPPLKWSAQFKLAESAIQLRGDKIILPPSALEQLLSAATTIVPSASNPQTSPFDPYNPYTYANEREARENLVERRQQLPHPLTFRLVNPSNGRVVYAGIREFSAEEGEVVLSTFLKVALGLAEPRGLKDHETFHDQNLHNGSVANGQNDGAPRITVHVEELPKGVFVKLRPLEAGYDPEDWKALLEQYLRDNCVTLTKGEILVVQHSKESFRFLVDELKPDRDAITLVDTDLEVDIEPLNEDQARETLQRLVQKSRKAAGSKEGSSVGGKVTIDVAEEGQVRPGDYVDYTLDRLDPKQDLEITLVTSDDENDLDLFVTPHGPKLRSRPREDEHVFSDMSTRPTKRIRIQHTNMALEKAEALWVSIRAYKDELEPPEVPRKYNLLISRTLDSHSLADHVNDNNGDTLLSPEEERCSNCHQAVPSRTMFLHQNFCLRNNILCTHCNAVFKKSSSEWKNHWHCPHDKSHGNTVSSKIKHDTLMHTATVCSSCDYNAANVPDLAHHRATTCPGKMILCQFCHLQVAQQGPDDQPADSAEVILSGLTPHELSDGARTTECHICQKIIRLRDMSVHLKHHDIQRLSRLRPRVCRNINCGRTIDGVGKSGDIRAQGASNDLGVCDACFGPLHVSMYDPDGKALKRRVERKYLTQFLTGCGQAWCRNEFCKTGRKHLGLLTESQSITSKDALAMIKPVLDNLKDMKVSLGFCTDQASQKRRTLAEMIAAEGSGSSGKGKGKEGEVAGSGYGLEWCIAALEVASGDLDKGRSWLKDFAPTRIEERG